jgi:hypothetical protein
MRLTRLVLAPLLVLGLLGCRGGDGDGDGAGGGGGGSGVPAGGAIGVEACNDYVDTVVDCYTEAGGDPSLVTDSITCAGQQDSTADYFACLTNVYLEVDCSDMMSLATLDATGCAP